jgi:hypothetical protein
MKVQFRAFLRGSVWYSEDCRTGRQSSLKTKNEEEARQLIQASNTAANYPAFNRAMAKSYLTVGGRNARLWRESQRGGVALHWVTIREQYITITPVALRWFVRRLMST